MQGDGARFRRVASPHFYHFCKKFPCRRGLYKKERREVERTESDFHEQSDIGLLKTGTFSFTRAISKIPDSGEYYAQWYCNNKKGQRRVST